MVLEIKANCQIKEVKLLLKDEDLNSLPFTRESWLTENTHTLYQKAIMIPCRIIKKYLIVCCPTRNIARRIKNIAYRYK